MDEDFRDPIFLLRPKYHGDDIPGDAFDRLATMQRAGLFEDEPTVEFKEHTKTLDTMTLRFYACAKRHDSRACANLARQLAPLHGHQWDIHQAIGWCLAAFFSDLAWIISHPVE